MDAGRMIKEMDRLHISLIDSQKYACVHDESIRQRKLLKAMGLSVTEDLDAIAQDINRKNNEAVVSQIHSMPAKTNPDESRPTGRKAKKLKDITEGRRPADNEPKPKGKPGRPKGSKNKVAAEQEQKEGTGQKRRPGRPKGSTKKKAGKKTTDTPKRQPGRPKGSKNKKTLLLEAKRAEQEKKKGRAKDNPKGGSS